MINLLSFSDKFKQASTEEEMAELKDIIQSQGYAFVNDWIIQLKKELEQADEEQLIQLEKSLKLAEAILPEPQKLSPLWEDVWSEMHFVLQEKKSVFQRVPSGEQAGEWQLLFNNPFSTEGIVLHPDLSFAEAAYRFAQYRKDLAKNEYISLQKVFRYITEAGE
ncbi:hypothetical protein [Ammoniphilus sp. 3BR4]|uniref:hypothetical protein n=1 Tax=Ammoniphilus sp. 3BR4 TaxID=3158265 RepID=UPI003465F70E